jgi:alpha-D-ribose 1-methylphosphonate 5-triphosphate synthase subunit PhnH
LGDDGEAARDWVAFHCGAPWADDSGHADFVWARTMPDLMTLAAGSDDAPQTGATLILEVAGFATGQTLHLAGPGLKEPGMLKVDGLPAAFATIWHANHARFPRGVDIILCAGTELVALPRSLRITSREG